LTEYDSVLRSKWTAPTSIKPSCRGDTLITSPGPDDGGAVTVHDLWRDFMEAE
jgi:hypothetical protein